MNLDISKAFLRPATPFAFEADVPLLQQDVNGETVSFDAVHLEGSYFVADDTVRVEGTLHTVAHASCALCLGPAEAPVEVTFDEMFRKDADENEDECFRFEGKTLPLDHMTLTLVMLNLPMRFVCSEGCKGTAEWQAWRNEAPETEAEEEAEVTYQPFAQLKEMMEKGTKH